MEAVFPPTDVDIMQSFELQREALACYHASDTDEGFAAAQVLADKHTAKKLENASIQAAFDEVVYCFSAATACEQMELNAKNPQLALAGRWKMIRVHAESRLEEYNRAKVYAYWGWVVEYQHRRINWSESHGH
jgi:hypothetical protein